MSYSSDNNESSVLENINVQATGYNPFERSNVWWYVIGISVFGAFGSYADQIFLQLSKNTGSWSFYTQNFSNIVRYIALPIIFTLLSKIMFLIFLHKKWGFVANSNAEVPYPSNVVWRNYITPIIYFISGSVLIGLISLGTTSLETAYFFLVIRILLLLALSIYLIIWNYRLLVFYPKYFNPITDAMKNRAVRLPVKIGLTLWALPVISYCFQYISFFMTKDGRYFSDEKKWSYHLSEYISTLSQYSISAYYFILAIYIYIVIKTAKSFYNNDTDIKEDYS